VKTLFVLVVATLACYAQSLGTYTVYGYMNPWLAAAPSGDTCCGGPYGALPLDSAPAESPLMVTGFQPGQFLTFSVTGQMNYLGNTPTDPTDGAGAMYTGPGIFFIGSTRYGMGGVGTFAPTLSRYYGPYDTLLGVFLAGNPPAQPGTQPATLDFTSTGMGTGFASLAPAIGQVFFIGDGLTGNTTGTPQHFIVPAGATALYLGGADGYQYAGDTGSFTVSINASSGTTSTFTFTGTCSDCSNPSGTLVLQDYTLGQSISAANFVSFTYSSSALNFTLLPSDNPVISGALPTSLPAPANVSLVGPGNKILISQQGGSWCGGSDCASDKGTSSMWTMATSSSVPAVSTPALIAMGLAMAALGAALLKLRRSRSAA
jgi:hypothetical protein